MLSIWVSLERTTASPEMQPLWSGGPGDADGKYVPGGTENEKRPATVRWLAVGPAMRVPRTKWRVTSSSTTEHLVGPGGPQTSTLPDR